MRKYDWVSALFFVGIAIAICVKSIQLGLSSLSNPGPGLIPFGCGLILGVMGLVLFGYTFKKTAEGGEVFWERGTQWRKMISILISLIGYAFLLEILGFKLITFLWMGFVCLEVGRMRWKWAVFTSVVTALGSYILFDRCLGVLFPRGIFGF